MDLRSIFQITLNRIQLILLLVIIVGYISCNISSNNQLPTDTQSLFWFGEDLISDDELPETIDPESVLCFGKGLKVGKCISNRLSEGKCLGLLKLKKTVVAVEIPCNVVHSDTIPLQG